ncbi:hypothetical protein Scep_021660 [Stephania cephalantha]|uniref:Uncharacterized protein n=1 Tax=Stephania cephalantha TaxID=152367 RepID=A0AAP0F4Y9_9MAGN
MTCPKYSAPERSRNPGSTSTAPNPCPPRYCPIPFDPLRFGSQKALDRFKTDKARQVQAERRISISNKYE